MKFAIKNGERVEAYKGAHGVCPGCGSDLIARCGEKKVNHWAHKGRRHCDHWWENETQWHRDWKNNFPTEWQERGAVDEHGERHVADVKSPKGRVVEFQHSYIKPDEARKRTKFYDNIIWVVDATRRKTDWETFSEALEWGYTHRTPTGDINELQHYSCRLIKEWVGLGRITAFDFGTDKIWLLRRIRPQRGGVLGFWYPKSVFVQDILGEANIPDVLFGEPKTARRRM